MKQFVLFLVFLMLGLSFSLAQSSSFKFEEDVHDFGVIDERGGAVNCTFEFENSEDVPLIIQSVKSSCGCTTPLWTKEPILPGKRGVIKAKFNPRNRVGIFSKSITVTTNMGVQKLQIKGEVAPPPKTLADLYPKRMGALRVETAYVMFNEMSKVQRDTIVIKAVNDSDANIKLDFGDLPKYITIETKEELLPLEKTDINIIYDASQALFYGFRDDIIPVLVNGKTRNSDSFVITSTILDDFSGLTEEQRKNAPEVFVNRESAVFQDVPSGEVVTMYFKIKNKGKDPLCIRNIDASSLALKALIDKKELASEEEGLITAVFDTKGKRGYQNEQISLVTNAPNNPVLNMRIIGIVFE